MKLTLRQRLLGRIDTPPKPLASLTLTVGQWNGMTLREWQESDTHIIAMQKLMRESVFRDVLAVLSNARPVASRTDVNHAFEHGRRVGYDELLSTLLRLPIMPPRPAPDVPTDYGALATKAGDSAIDDLDIN